MEIQESFDPKPVKKVYSRIGWALCAIIATLIAVQLLIDLMLGLLWPEGCWLTDSSTGPWLLNFVPLYLIAMPVGILVMKRIPMVPPVPNKMGAKNFIIFVFISFFLTYTGSIIGSMLSAVISGGQAQNALDAYSMSTDPVKILFMVILAPLFEEYIFRKQLIDRTSIYGEKIAVFLSALTFGLFHMNLFQFFYAFLLGWVFGYIYIRTGKLRYTVLLHGIINFMGGVIAPAILSMLDLEKLSSIPPTATEEEIMAIYSSMLPGLVLFGLYFLLLMGLFITGLVLFVQHCQKLKWLSAQQELPSNYRVKAVYLNAGMLVFVILCTTMTVLSVIL